MPWSTMMNAAAANTCPEWQDNIPPAEQIRFKIALRAVYSIVLQHAGSSIAGVEDIGRWHGQLFSIFVPVPYYAGNRRQENEQMPCLAIDVQVGGIAGESYVTVTEKMRLHFEVLRKELSRSELYWPLLTPQQRSLRLAQVLAGWIGGFIRIHPFVNGNGRVSRLMWAWGLIRFGVPPQQRLHPRPEPPYGDVMALSMRGDDRPLAMMILKHLGTNPPSRSR